MNQDQLLAYLVEAKVEDTNVQAFFDRLMMRLFESPPLLASFVNATIFEEGHDVVVQLEFQRVPKEFHQDLAKIAGARDIQILNYDKNSMQFTGLQVRLSTEDITPKRQDDTETELPFQAGTQQDQGQPVAKAGSSIASV